MFYLGCYKRIALRKRFLFTTKWGSITAIAKSLKRLN
ncbi:hypothetical protein EcE24377A_3188 [Escherichia coli O139:H28 str. E24377A]|uniref:Uncharacterized protein n=1 Tax=Escherichia coli O139:H28 (strain E24377A / ETEC) TaxID=331111 RepID=A7ZQX2_ECO24|nr:hypothetical protein EcE24377A_3188 [Escherichia coli O139:H28 str. E24377A]